MSATVKVIEGVGTERARVPAEVTTEDVRDYCENWYPGADRLAACMKDNSADLGKGEMLFVSSERNEIGGK